MVKTVHPRIIAQIEPLLRDILRFSSPADVTLSCYFRDHPQCGRQARGIITETVYSVLRYKSLFIHLADCASIQLVQRLVLLGLKSTVGIEALRYIPLDSPTRHWLFQACQQMQTMQQDKRAFPIECLTNLPPWLFDKLLVQKDKATALAFIDALNQPASLDGRVNTLKQSRDQVIHALATEGIVARSTPYAPTGIRCQGKPSLQHLPLFKAGWIEVQDEGSQLLAQMVGAKRHEMVVDFCAGAGGKTLALGAMMRNTGRLYAFDVSEKRLAKLKPRLIRSGLSNVYCAWITDETDTKIKRFAGKVDRVLVDVPCSGLGILRRNPEIKWRQTPQTIAEMAHRQQAILSCAACLLKPGGRLVYGTCSWLKEENEAIVEMFLTLHPEFFLLPAYQVLAEQRIALEMGDYLILCPQTHQTDSFFAAVLVRGVQ